MQIFTPPLISNITVANGKTYERDTVAASETMFIDRTYTFTTVPTAFAGQEFIRTANDDKQLTTVDFLSFDLAQSAAVYVAYDTRYTRPRWLASWTDTGQDIVGTDQIGSLARRLYRRDFPAGRVVLGGNATANAGTMYTVIAVPQTETVAYRIDSGGSGYTSAAGVVWAADNYFTGGRNSSYSGAIAYTADDALYNNGRSTDSDTAGFSYAFPVTNGTYSVRLHFAEIYFTGASGRGPGGSNRRVFDVQIEGATVLDNYDINAAIGSMAAEVRTFSVNVTDGTLNINFPPASVNRPLVAAIEIVQP
ncbi:MAG: malectin [bacterium]|nr:malectin [bacterium]